MGWTTRHVLQHIKICRDWCVMCQVTEASMRLAVTIKAREKKIGDTGRVMGLALQMGTGGGTGAVGWNREVQCYSQSKRRDAEECNRVWLRGQRAPSTARKQDSILFHIPSAQFPFQTTLSRPSKLAASQSYAMGRMEMRAVVFGIRMSDVQSRRCRRSRGGGRVPFLAPVPVPTLVLVLVRASCSLSQLVELTSLSFVWAHPWPDMQP